MESPIKQLRQDRSMRKTDFAALLTITKEHLNELEIGYANMTAADGTAFATLGVNVHQLDTQQRSYVTSREQHKYLKPMKGHPRGKSKQQKKKEKEEKKDKEEKEDKDKKDKKDKDKDELTFDDIDLETMTRKDKDKDK